MPKNITIAKKEYECACGCGKIITVGMPHYTRRAKTNNGGDSHYLTVHKPPVKRYA